MMAEVTELEWTYEPTDYFEVPFGTHPSSMELSEDGHVLATLTIPTAPVSDHLEQRIKAMIDGIFLVRQIQTHRAYTLRVLERTSILPVGKTYRFGSAASRL